MIKRDYYLNRLISKKENGLIKIITGIRRCGKSYLLFELYKSYLNSTGIDDTHIIQIQLDKKSFEDYRNPNRLYEYILEKINGKEKFYIFIDEIQLCPELLNECHFLIEELNIRFLLTGSSARKLRSYGTNLLGGRAWERHLHPFTFAEVGGDVNYNLPYIFEHGLLPSMFYSSEIEEDLSSYIGTYLTEEISAEGTARNLSAFARFLKTAALTNGQLLNFTNIANDSQVPVQTVKQWYKVLEDTLLGFMVEPFTASKRRKSISTSKFYLFDIAVARVLQNISVPSEGNEEFGEYFEQLVCMELKAWISYRSPRSRLTFWRTTGGTEVDFCIDDELAIEVKSTETVTDRHLKGLKALREEEIFKRYIVVCREEYPRKVDGIEILPWKYFFESLWTVCS